MTRTFAALLIAAVAFMGRCATNQFGLLLLPMPGGVTAQMPIAPPKPNHTNPPPTISFQWISGDLSFIAGTQVAIGHASGSFDITNFIPASNGTIVNFAPINLNAPYVIKMREVGTNGMTGDWSTEFWWNVGTDDTKEKFYTVNGARLIGFVARSNWSYQLAGIMGTAGQTLPLQVNSNAIVAIAFPAPGYWRITRSTN
jgi:hypothetical protein